MTPKTFGSFFSGGGLADAGAVDAGFTPVFAVECDPANYKQSMRIADCYENNFGKHVIRKPVQELIMSELPRVDWFHASPVCKNASNAKKDGEENNIDIITAQSVIDYIDEHRPSLVTVENVYGYRKFQAFQMILKCLSHNGYDFKVDKLNAADFGVAQTRIRLFIRATLSDRVPSLRPTHTKYPDPSPRLFGTPLKKWVGWYESVANIIHTFPDSEFAPWQKNKLEKEGFQFDKTMVIGQGEWSRPLEASEPFCTVTANRNQKMIKSFIVSGASTADVRNGIDPALSCVSSERNMSGVKMFLAEGRTAGDRGLQYREVERPAMTITTATGGNIYRMFLASGLEFDDSMTVRNADVNHPSHMYIGRVARITPEGIARFMSLPDWYQLPDNSGDAIALLGNGVPSLLMQRIGESWQM